MAVQTVDADLVHYRQQFIGQLGWLEVKLPNSYYAAARIALLVAFIASRPVAGAILEAGRAGPAFDHAGRFGRHLHHSGPFAIQYLTWTAPGSALVEGVQGRYFIVLVLLALRSCALFCPQAGRRHSTGPGLSPRPSCSRLSALRS